MSNTSKFLSWVFVVFASLALIGAADAMTIFAPNPPTVTPLGTTYRWDYDVIVSTGSEVRSGDGFTIYDFAGFRGVGTPLPGSWSLNSSQTNAPDYTFQTRATTDNAAIIDLILTYSGPTLGSPSSNTVLGIFSFISDFGLPANSFFESSDHTIFNDAAQTDNHNTQVPTGVPEPGMVGMIGLFGLILARRRSRRAP
jgi:hypothetical protein